MFVVATCFEGNTLAVTTRENWEAAARGVDNLPALGFEDLRDTEGRAVGHGRASDFKEDSFKGPLEHLPDPWSIVGVSRTHVFVSSGMLGFDVHTFRLATEEEALEIFGYSSKQPVVS